MKKYGQIVKARKGEVPFEGHEHGTEEASRRYPVPQH